MFDPFRPSQPTPGFGYLKVSLCLKFSVATEFQPCVHRLRLSAVQNSDVIMVLDHGRIIERGNHEKLIAEKGTYYRLYTGAFELE